MGAITLSGVGKVYAGGQRAVGGVGIDIADGEFLVLVGPSGCGKSTLLRMIAGLESITEGEVRIAGRVVNDVEPADRDIAMVFQNYALYPHMTVRQNLAYGLKNRRTPRTEIDRRVEEAARMLELGRFLDRRPRQLSGGQRQRVAMGRAIVREPAAFLFDEPLSNLDAKLRVQMRGEIKQLQARLGTTSIYVTHDQLEAMTLAHRLVVLNGGRVEQIGAPLEIYHRPASTFVASFIGSPAMNLIEGRVAGGRLAIGPADLGRIGGAASGPVMVGIRPEDLRIGPGPASTPGASTLGASSLGAATLTLRLSYVEELGAQRLLHGLIEGQPATAIAPPGAPLGESVALGLDPARLHLFDLATGQRLPAERAAPVPVPAA